MKNTTLMSGGAVAGVSLSAVAPCVASVAASHLAVAVRLHGGARNGLNGVAGGVGRGIWRGQPSLGSDMSTGMSFGAPAAIAAVPAAKGRQLDRVTSKQIGVTKFRTTVYEGPRPWKVPV
jgi:hypothetical protein